MTAYQLHQGDALDVLRSLPDASVDLIVTDPPYYRFKAEWWDRQWDTATGFLAWLDRLVEQWARVLKPNGSLYVFASSQMAARVECKVAERLEVLNHIVWAKPDPSSEINYGAGIGGRTSKAALRSFYPNTERIIFAERKGSDSMAKGEAGYAAKCDELRGFVFEPLRAYLCAERDAAGWTSKRIDAAWQAARNNRSNIAVHWFSAKQWQLPTEANYEWLRSLFNANGGAFLARGYAGLRAEYERLREDYESLRRPFAATPDAPYTDVWTFRTVNAYKGKHPCEKPEDLIQHIIRTSSRPGAVVLDSFTGSGVVGAVALQEGRTFIGSEIDQHWCAVAEARLRAASPVKPAAPAQVEALPLFAARGAM